MRKRTLLIAVVVALVGAGAAVAATSSISVSGPNLQCSSNGVSVACPSSTALTDGQSYTISARVNTPGPPTNVVATPGNGSASVTWTAPSDNGGSAVTGYTVTPSGGAAPVTVSGSSTSATVSGLTNGQSYTFTVHATNAKGDSPESQPSNAVTLTAPSGGGGGTGGTVEHWADFETGNWSQFSDGLNTSGGTGAIVTNPLYAGKYSATTSVNAGSGNTYSRDTQNLQGAWPMGSEHWFGGEFYLPPGTEANEQGDIALERWDDYALANTSQDQYGVWQYGNESPLHGHIFLFFNNVNGGEQSHLVEGPALTEGAWHCIEVRDKLGATDGSAANELWVDGQQVGTTNTAHNTLNGRLPTKIRYGVVAINDATQTKALTVGLDNLYTASGRLGCQHP